MRRRVIGNFISTSVRSLSSASGPALPPAKPQRYVPPQQSAQVAKQKAGRLLPKKKVAKLPSSRRPDEDSSRVTAHVMANAHDPLELASAL